MLVVDQLGYRYRAASRPSLEGVSLTAERGQVLGLLGPNGAGKTTLISVLAGLLPVQQGQVMVDGLALAAQRVQAPTRIAVAPQDFAFYPMLTVAENLRCFAAAARLRGVHRAERVRACLALARLQGVAGVRADRLSGGLKRRLNLAIALLPEPQLVLFDEPTVGVDPQSRAFVLDAIRALADDGMAVIYATHYMEEVESIADRVAILDRGRLLREGPLAQLLAEGGRLLRLWADGLDGDLLARFGPVSRAGAAWCVQLDAAARPSAVLAALDAAGVHAQQIEYGAQNLEQLFMALTDRGLRDVD